MQYTGIYAITDDLLLPGENLFSAVEAALEGGISLLQYRSKADDFAHKLECASRLLGLCRQHHTPLIINDDIELCAASGAHGVHLGEQDGSYATARTRLGPDAIVGITCHSSLDTAIAAQQMGADYVAFGRFFRSATKPAAAPATLAILGRAREQLSIPIVAIGGINAENGAAALHAGADMLAVVHALFGGDDVRSRARQLVRLCTQNHDHKLSRGGRFDEQ